jgi:hypothetical protein
MVVAELELGDAHGWRGREVEAFSTVVAQMLFEARQPRLVWKRAKICVCEGHPRGLRDELRRRRQAFPCKRGTKGPEDVERLLPTAFKPRRIDRLVELGYDLLDVRPGMTIEQPVEQHALLDRGQWIRIRLHAAWI